MKKNFPLSLTFLVLVTLTTFAIGLVDEDVPASAATDWSHDLGWILDADQKVSHTFFVPATALKKGVEYRLSDSTCSCVKSKLPPTLPGGATQELLPVTIEASARGDSFIRRRCWKVVYQAQESVMAPITFTLCATVVPQVAIRYEDGAGSLVKLEEGQEQINARYQVAIANVQSGAIGVLCDTASVSTSTSEAEYRDGISIFTGDLSIGEFDRSVRTHRLRFISPDSSLGAEAEFSVITGGGYTVSPPRLFFRGSGESRELKVLARGPKPFFVDGVRGIGVDVADVSHEDVLGARQLIRFALGSAIRSEDPSVEIRLNTGQNILVPITVMADLGE